METLATQAMSIHIRVQTHHRKLVYSVSSTLREVLKIYTRGYRKIPKISPGADIFQRPFLRGLFLEGLVFGGAYLWKEICVSKSIGLAL